MQPTSKKCLLVTIVSLFVFCLGGEAMADISSAKSNGAVASVNGTIIGQSQFDNAMGYQKEMAALRGVTITDDILPELKYQVLENLINQELLYQASQKAGINISKDEIEKTYEANKAKANFDTDAEFEEALKKSNKTLPTYRDEIGHGLAIDRFIQTTFTDKTTVADSEAESYYTQNPGYFIQAAQVRASHIMVRFDQNADASQKEEAKKKIEKVKKRLNAGEEFAAVAKEVSEDANTKENGGELGYFYKGQYPQAFEDAAFALKKDQTSDIVETSAGYHIIKLSDKKDARTISFEEVKGDIVDSLKSSKVNSLVDSYIKGMKNRSTIVTYPISQ